MGQHRVAGAFNKLYCLPGGAALAGAWGSKGAPSYLVGDLASKGHPCSWKETHRLKLENCPRGPDSLLPGVLDLRLQGAEEERLPKKSEDRQALTLAGRGVSVGAHSVCAVEL